MSVFSALPGACLGFLVVASLLSGWSVDAQSCSCSGSQCSTQQVIGAGERLSLSGTSVTCSASRPAQQAYVYTVSATAAATSDSWEVDQLSGGTYYNEFSGTSSDGYCGGPYTIYSSTNVMDGLSLLCNNDFEDCDIYAGWSAATCATPGSARSYACTAGCYPSNLAACCNNGDNITYTSSNFCYCEPATTTSNTYSWVLTSSTGCSAPCGGGTNSTTYTCQDQNGNSVPSSDCTGPNPSSSYPCNTAPCSSPASSTGTSAQDSSSSTAAAGGSSVAAPWPGTYAVQPMCSQSQCCCLTGKVTVESVGTNLVLQGAVAGQCQQPSTTLEAAYPTGYVANIPASTGVDPQTVTLSSDGNTITTFDHINAACSGQAMRVSSSSNGVSSDIERGSLAIAVAGAVLAVFAWL